MAQGPAKLTTNRVAQKAGVSIGSLYHYFPNKEAIIAELARRRDRRTEQAITEALTRHADGSLDEVVGAVIDVLTGELLGPVEARRSLQLLVPPDWTWSTVESVTRAVREQVATLLRTRHDVRQGDPELMAFVVGHAVERLVETAVLDAPERLASPAFRAELQHLVVSYLSPASH